jgi:hypothetical protein
MFPVGTFQTSSNIVKHHLSTRRNQTKTSRHKKFVPNTYATSFAGLWVSWCGFLSNLLSDLHFYPLDMISQELCAEKNLTSYVSLCFSDKYLTTKKQTRHVNKRKAKTTKKKPPRYVQHRQKRVFSRSWDGEN